MPTEATNEAKAKLIVRHARLSDVEAVRRLYRKVYPQLEPYKADQLRGQINNFPQGQFVAVYEDQVVGYCATFRIGETLAFKAHTWTQITGNGFAARHDPDALPQAVLEQVLVRLRQAALEGQAGVKDRARVGRAGAAHAAADRDHVGAGLGHADRDRAEVGRDPLAAMRSSGRVLTGGLHGFARLAAAASKVEPLHVNLEPSALEAAIELEEKCPEAWALLGHLKFMQGKNIDARNAYQTALPLLEAQSLKPVSLMTGLVQVYIRLGKLYLEEKEFYGSAKEVYLRCCKRMPSASVWLGVGKACMKLGSMHNTASAALARVAN